MRCLRLISVVFCILLPAAVLAEKQPTVALVGGTIVNLDGGAPLKNATILVEDESLDGDTLREACDLLFDERLTAMSAAAPTSISPSASRVAGFVRRAPISSVMRRSSPPSTTGSDPTETPAIW